MPIAAYCRPLAYRAFAENLSTIDTPEGLFRAAWAIAQHEIPEAGLAAGEAVVSKLAMAVRRRVRSGSSEALLAHLHDVLFDVAGFRGNRDDYYNPANSYLPEVLRTRRGLPIALALVYRRVAAEAGLVVHGVNAPGHFLAEAEVEEPGGKRSIYVDPFFGGGMLHQSEVFERIAEATGQQVAATPEMLGRATPRQWLARMLHNLQAALAAAGRERDVFAMQELEHLLHVA
jgi:regulator of sirC expression with transglutaminase-like and TPR domain